MQGFQQAVSQSPARLGSGEAAKALYVGNLHPFVTDAMLQEIFSTLGQVGEIKIIKDKLTGLSAGYGFVQFLDHRAAEMALQSLNGRVLHGQSGPDLCGLVEGSFGGAHLAELRVNWAFQKDQREDSASQFQIFVGDLASDINDKLLCDAFQSCGCSDARVMWDHNTGRSKGYGFVSFKTRVDAEKALSQMSGTMLGSRRIRCGWAQHKQENSQASYAAVDRADPENANVYVGNLAPDVTDAELQQHVSQFGTVLDVKIYRKGGYAFAQFASHAEAVRAIVGLSGQNLGGKALKCSWGRHQARKVGGPQMAVDPSSLEWGLALQQQQQQQQQQQMSLQQQLAMQQLGYAPTGGYGAQGMNPLGMPGAPPPPPHMAGPLSPQQQLAQQQLAAQQLGAQQFMAPGQQQLDFSNFYYGGGMYYQ